MTPAAWRSLLQCWRRSTCLNAASDQPERTAPSWETPEWSYVFPERGGTRSDTQQGHGTNARRSFVDPFPVEVRFPNSDFRLPASLVRHPEIGVDHILVALHLGRRAIGNLAAVVEHHHPVRQVHHHAHVVLDEGDGRVECVFHGE